MRCWATGLDCEGRKLQHLQPMSWRIKIAMQPQRRLYPSAKELRQNEISRRNAEGTIWRLEDLSPDKSGHYPTQLRLESSVGDSQDTQGMHYGPLSI